MLNYREIKVDKNNRLDKFISNFLSISRTLAQEYISKNLVRVNDQIVSKPSKIVKAGDIIYIEINLHQIKSFKNIDINQENLEIYSQMNIPIIYEDENILCLNKPVINVNKVGDKPSIFEYLLLSGRNPFIVHRLDKQTTGCLVVAKNYQTAMKVSKLFKERLVKKKYLAVSEGELRRKLIIQAPIYHLKNPLKKEIVSFGKDSITIVKPLKIFTKNEFYEVLKIKENVSFRKNIEKFSLLDIEIITGRTHQIRVHLSSLNNPVVGDLKYGSSITLPFFLLHSYYISFELDKKYTFECFPDWLNKKVLD